MRVYFDYVLAFWISIGSLSLCQGVMVALPRAWEPGRLARLHSPLWALVPAISVVGFVAVGQLSERESARVLTYLALVAVPLLAALSLGWLIYGAKPGFALIVVPLFALAWADRGGLAGEGAALVLSALSCVALGALIAGVTPARWLAVGIIAMALADTALVVSDLLQAPNNALNAAHPPGGLPRLQAAMFGSAVMGYGDLFVAGVLGGLLAAAGDRSRQLTGAVLVALLAVAFDFLFFVVDELPATVPVAAGLVVLIWGSRRRGLSWDGARSQRPRVEMTPDPRAGRAPPAPASARR